MILNKQLQIENSLNENSFLMQHIYLFSICVETPNCLYLDYCKRNSELFLTR